MPHPDDERLDTAKAPHPDDERLGQLMRAVRRRLNISQRQLALLAGVPRSDILAIEDDRGGSVRVERARAAFEALDARLKLVVFWHGSAADRLLDEQHAALVERALRLLARRKWEMASEVTFADYGERGSVDVLGLHREASALLIGEVKNTIGSLEETNRSLDVKTRLGPKICRARFGVTPSHVSRVLIVPDDRTVRRILTTHAATIGSIYPMQSRDFRTWLRNPTCAVSAIWFVSKVANGDRSPA
jgi:transcriptional regulator with XRE-family HTH domain